MISVVIICKNAIGVIENTLLAAMKLTNDIVVVDTGSTDGTLEKLQMLQCKVITSQWKGYGPTKNFGIQHAQYDWILSLDSDERIDDTLIQSIKSLSLQNEAVLYKIGFLNYLGNTPLHFGEWSGDQHVRLFNRNNTQWNDAEVHEILVHQKTPEVKKIQGKIHHYTSANKIVLRKKLEHYALLNAQNYQSNGKQFSFVKKYASSIFNFIKNYFFKFGFLDGVAGWIVAYENARYTFNKYKYWEKIKNESN